MSDVFTIHPLTRVHENAYMIFKVVFVCLKLFYKGLEPTELKCFCVLSTFKTFTEKRKPAEAKT